jgi:hypothetical protein
MIQTQSKRYQISLWFKRDRSGPGPALRLEFDDVEEARAEFDKHKAHGRYQSGILLEFHKVRQEWSLLDQFS